MFDEISLKKIDAKYFIIRISRFRAGIPVIIGICTVQNIRKNSLLSYFISTFSDVRIISMERRIH